MLVEERPSRRAVKTLLTLFAVLTFGILLSYNLPKSSAQSKYIAPGTVVTFDRTSAPASDGVLVFGGSAGGPDGFHFF